MVKEKTSFTLVSSHNKRPFLSDITYVKNGKSKPILLFIHGFKGFKDFAFFNVLSDQLADKGLVVVKMNLSHNGTTVDNPIDFMDLEAFGNNNYTIESDDIGSMLDHIESEYFQVPSGEIDQNQIFLMGHSRGGGISIVKASEDNRIKKLVTWASVSTLTSVMPVNVLEEWKKNGVHYVFNGRTKQEMPLYYQLAENYLENEERFNILKCESKLNIPHLIVHGDQDETVNVDSAKALKANAQHGQLVVIQGGSHTLGGYHPYQEDQLPEHAQIAFEDTIQFLTQ